LFLGQLPTKYVKKKCGKELVYIVYIGGAKDKISIYIVNMTFSTKFITFSGMM
jgi:hypothetical protein